MANILYLVHRLPYPPNKGDKVRSFHLLKHLAARHRVFLGTFIDDDEDDLHVESLRGLCAGLHVTRLNPRRARARCLRGLLTGEALTPHYYRDTALQAWVDRTCREQVIDAVVVVSSAMAQYVDNRHMPLLVDFVDVDSAKWTKYALVAEWPMSWLYRREGKRLLAFEQAVAARARRAFFVTAIEADRFCRLVPECAQRIDIMSNGVDADYFVPSADRPSPYVDGESAVVFTGTMDYWPNIDAVTWFAGEILPILRAQCPTVRFWIVGRNPTGPVRALAGAGIAVTGAVLDVRPYLQHAAVVVAPLRVAPGIQNKILEAMAMGRPVVASKACAGAIDADVGRDLVAAESAAEFAVAIEALLDSAGAAAAMGEEARERVLDHYQWEEQMTVIDRYLPSPCQEGTRI